LRHNYAYYTTCGDPQFGDFGDNFVAKGWHGDGGVWFQDALLV
jgi:hypothetical protein